MLVSVRLWIELWAHVCNVGQELLKHTAGDDPGRGALDEALGLVQSINGYINEYVRSAERAQALVQIQSNMSGLKGGWVGRACPAQAFAELGWMTVARVALQH
jgi:hypothetical protein